MSFDAFKKKSNISDMVAKIEKETAKKDFKSEFYYPTISEKGTASAVIRFLPSKNGNDLPYVIKYSHNFSGDDGKYVWVDLCPTSINEDCPVCALNSELWKTELPENQKIVRDRKRKKDYIFNILVVKDPSQPDLEGTVQPYKAGQTIYNKIMTALAPEFESQTPKDPFDIMDGYDFHLNIKRDPAKNNQVTYEASVFSEISTPICGGNEDAMRVVYENMADLKEKYLNPSKLMDADTLNAKLAKAYCNSSVNTKSGTEYNSYNNNKTSSSSFDEQMNKKTDTSSFNPLESDYTNDIGSPFPGQVNASGGEDDWLAELAGEINDKTTKLDDMPF